MLRPAPQPYRPKKPKRTGQIRRRPFARVAATLAILALALTAPAAGAQAPTDPVRLEGAPPYLAGEIATFLKRETSAPAGRFDAQRQADTVVAFLQRLLESEGYYLASFEAEIAPSPPFAATILITPGPPFSFLRPHINWRRPPERDVAELTSILSGVAEGSPAVARTALSTADALIRTLQSNGYPDASLADIDALANGAGHTLELTFGIDPGAFSTFGALEITPALRTRATYIERLKPWAENETFSAEKLSVFRQRLSDTGLYSTVAVEPQESGRTGTTERTLRIDLEERPRRTIALGATLSTSDGIGVDGAWELRNVTGRGDSLEAVAQLATREDSIEFAYGAPNRGRYGRDARIAARYADTRTDAFDQRGVTLVATMKEPLSRSLLGAIGVEASYASISDERSRGLRERDREAWTLGGSAEIDLATTDDVLDPRQGVRARLKAEPSLGISDTIIGLTRLHADASYYVSFWDERGTLALRARLGAVFSPPGAPPGKLFFAGGGGSVRGFDFQSLSPAGDDGAPKGGRSLTEGSLEIRFRTRARAGYVVFIDAGRAGVDPAPTLKNLGIGAGLGLRYDAGFGPLRADIAFPLNRRDGDAAAHLYLSIGQAF